MPLYAATKKSNMLLKGETIQIFTYGNCKRYFTYVDDIVEGVKWVMQALPEKKNGEDGLRRFVVWYKEFYQI